MVLHCAVKGCSNGVYQLRKWKAGHCNVHQKLRNDCSCENPFKLIPFPTVKKQPQERVIWIKLINSLMPGSKNKLFEPKRL